MRFLLLVLLALASLATEDALYSANVDTPATPFVFEDEQRPLVPFFGFTHLGFPLLKVYYGTIMHPHRFREQEAAQA